MKKCLVSGSFDPITNGHIDIIKKASEMCDIVIVGVFNNEEKEYAFDIKDRFALCKIACENMPKVQVYCDNGMVCDFCKKHNIDLIIRGFRNNVDYAYETEMAKFNFFHSGVMTYILPASKLLDKVSSSMVREAISKLSAKNIKIEDSCAIDKKEYVSKSSDFDCATTSKNTNDMEINDLLPTKVWAEIRRIKNA